MPFLQIFTNVAKSKIPENFGPFLAKAASEVLRDKSVDIITVQVTTDQYISIGNRDDIPIALVYLQSIGSVDFEDNRRTVKALTQIINSKLDIEPINIRMIIQSHVPSTIGLNGELVMDFLK